MLSLRQTNELVCIDNYVTPSTQFMEMNGLNYPIIPVSMPELIVSLDSYIVFAFRGTHELPNYLVNFRSSFNTKRYLRVPNRVVNLGLRFSNIRCINSYAYKLNQKHTETIIPGTILRIDLTSTSLCRPPIGFFISIFMTNNVTRQRKSRESIINYTHYEAPKIVFVYMCKSIRDFELPGLVGIDILKLVGLNHFSMYNVCKRIEKSINYDEYGVFWTYRLKFDAKS